MQKFKIALLFAAFLFSWPGLSQEASPPDDQEPGFFEEGASEDPSQAAEEPKDEQNQEATEEFAEDLQTEESEEERAEHADKSDESPASVDASKPSYQPAELDSEPIPHIRRKKETLDYNFPQGIQKIPHPNAQKGLYRITKDKIYLYRVKTSDQTKASSFRIGMYDPINLGNEDQAFADVYDPPNGPILLYDYEWQIWRGGLGKFGIRVGTGLFFAQGVGRLETSGEPSREKFTFLAFPSSLSAIYRFQYWDKQVLVPFVDGGADVFTFAEFRDDDAGPKFGGSFAAHVAGGASFLLNFLDADSMLELDREYSINNVWLTGEVRQYFPITTKFDFSATVFNAGITVEF